VAAPTTVKVGAHVETDPTGRAELNYPDGSVSRLDHSTNVVVLALATADNGNRIKLDSGRIWQRIIKLSGTDQRSVVTPVGVASVRGTAFVASCTPEPACTFTVWEGLVEIAPRGRPPVTLRAGQRVSVTDKGAGPTETIPLEALRSDPWIAENLARDAKAAGTTVAAPASSTTALPPPATTQPPRPPAVVFASDKASPGHGTDLYRLRAGALERLTTHDGVCRSVAGPAVDYAHPTVAADDTIVFEARNCGGSHLVERAANGTQTTLPGGDRAVNPAFSPDGQRIAYDNSFIGQNPGLFIYDRATRKTTQVANTGQGATAPAWSPDGRQLAFVDFDSGISVVATNGAGLHKIAVAVPNGAAHEPDSLGAPAWSPDGKTVALEIQGNSSMCRTRIGFVVIGGSTTPTERFPQVNSCGDSHPAWSADGARLVFQGYDQGGQGMSLFVVNADGSGPHRITNPTPGSADILSMDPAYVGAGEVTPESVRGPRSG
jgi:hypothetical protein